MWNGKKARFERQPGTGHERRLNLQQQALPEIGPMSLLGLTRKKGVRRLGVDSRPSKNSNLGRLTLRKRCSDPIFRAVAREGMMRDHEHPSI